MSDTVTCVVSQGMADDWSKELFRGFLCEYLNTKTVLYLIVVGDEQPSRGMPGGAMPSGVKAIG